MASHATCFVSGDLHPSGWHVQMKTEEAPDGRAREQRQPKQQRQPTSSAGAVRMAAPGIARLTADEDGLVVHHCLANRRDLHAEYPPGAAPTAGDAALGSQGDAVGSSEGNQPGQRSAVKGVDQVTERSEQQNAERLMATSRDHAGELVTPDAGDATATGAIPGLLRFPWECGPLLEALLHNATGLQETSNLGRDAPPPITIANLPVPEPGCGISTQDVIDALISEGVLVAA